jgi:hypothetical protein
MGFHHRNAGIDDRNPHVKILGFFLISFVISGFIP